MRHTLLFLIAFVSLSFGSNLPALEVTWPNLCASSTGRELMLTTQDGETVRGFCMSVDVNHVQMQTIDHKIVKIAKTTLSKIQVDTSRNQLKALGRGMSSSLRDGTRMLFSPLAPVGLVVVPSTLAWGAVAAPFCILGDLAHGSGKREIKVLP